MKYLLCVPLFAGLALADGPIRLPVQDPPPPMPAPAAEATKLPPGSLFVVDSDVPVVVMASPNGLVSISPEEGPMKIRGVFAGSDKPQTKTFKGKYLHLIEAADGKGGKCELFVVPLGLKGEQDVIRRVLDVGAGNGPQPPPGPGPDPKPPVWDESPLIVLVIEETSDAAGTRGAFFTDATLAKRMSERKHRWRVVDKDVVGPDGKPPEDLVRFLDASKGKTLPQVFLVDGKGKVRFQGDCPAKASDLISLMAKVGG